MGLEISDPVLTVRPATVSGRIFGPVGPELAPAVHVNRFGRVPKGPDTGQWRLIVDLSFPKGASPNDGTEPELCTVQYTSIDEACRRPRVPSCAQYKTKGF